MSHGFSRASLVVELAEDWFPDDPLHLQHPAGQEKPILRVYVHETLHFWQTLSQGFLANLAASEWRAVADFEARGDLSLDDTHSRALQEFVRPHPDLGFSAQQLSEGLCRYWDIHILGPRLLRRWRTGVEDDANGRARSAGYFDGEFDGLMLEEDAYAGPYRLALERWGTTASVVLFPLVGHFAMQTPRPLQVFAAAIEQMAPRLDFEGRPKVSIHEEWRRHFAAAHEACTRAALACVGQLLTPGWDVVARGPLGKHPVYAHYLRRVAVAGRIWGDRVPFSFATPGDPESRALLSTFFQPPATSLLGGHWTGAPDVKAMGLEGQAPGLEEKAEATAQEALRIRAAERRMQTARLLQRRTRTPPRGSP